MRRAVVDQPGLKVIFFGLLISIFVGLIIRSQITNHKIKEYVTQVFKDLEEKSQAKKLTIDFSDAKLLLSDWGLPFPHILIQNIKISAAAPECTDNQVYIETLDIPISWISLFQLKNQFTTARLGSVELRLNNLQRCVAINENKENTTASKDVGLNSQSLSVKSRDVANETPPQEFNLYIEKLKIIDKHNYNLPVLLQTVGGKVMLQQGKVNQLDLRSQVYLFRDFDQGIYRLKSDMSLNYGLGVNNIPEASLAFRGKLIDKPFELNLELDDISQKVIVNHKMTDVSLKALMSLNFDESEKNLKQLEGISGIALSSEGHGEYNLKDRKLDFYQIDDMMISSGDSKATIDQVKISSIKPLVFETFEIVIAQFELEKLRTISAFASIQKSVSDFGRISGVVKVSEPSEIVAEGVLKDLQLIFSNRGQRANQKIDSLNYKIDHQQISLNQIVMDGQPVEGQFKFQMKPLKVYADLSNIKLNQNVYEIFSFSTAQPKQVEMVLNGDDKYLKSKIKFDQLSSPAVDVKNVEINYEAQLAELNKGRSHAIELNVKKLKIHRSDTLDPSFYSVLEELGDKNESKFDFEGVKAQYKSLNAGESTELKITAAYLTPTKNEKNNIVMQSAFKNSSAAQFKTDVTHHGKALKNFNFNANLSNFTFEVIK